MQRRRSRLGRFVDAYLAAGKRSSDQIWNVPGGDNPLWPDPPRVPDPPGPRRRPWHDPRPVVDYSPAALARIIVIILGLIVLGLVLFGVAQAVGFRFV